MKIVNFILILFSCILLSGCSKINQKLGLHFDSRFNNNEKELIQPPFLEEDLEKVGREKKLSKEAESERLSKLEAEFEGLSNEVDALKSQKEESQKDDWELI